jgi:inner membrane protein
MIALLPEQLDIKAEVVTETRSRGIFDAETYTAKLRFSGRFDEASLDKALLEDGWQLRPDQAMVALGMSDPVGLQDDVSFAWDGKAAAAESGVPASFLSLDGVHWPVPIFGGENSNAFEIEIALRGSAALSLLPAGRTSSLQVAGNWPSPSFDGASLPQTQEVGDDGFSAEWRISHLSRVLPQSWGSFQSPQIDWRESTVGVKFLDPVDFYRLSERSVKYGALFIALSFLVLLLFEVLLGLAIHPIQYLLVGGALVQFFLSLVAFAEIIGFAPAYAVSALIVAGMISLYAAAVLRRYLWGGVLFATAAALYGLLFVVLRLEEAALLSGTLVLLTALGLTMYVTRRIDWYAPGAPPLPPISSLGGADAEESPL